MFYMFYLSGKYIKGNKHLYHKNGKGNFLGKTIFSTILIGIILSPILLVGSENFLKPVGVVFWCMMCFEFFEVNGKINFFGFVLLILSFISLAVLPFVMSAKLIIFIVLNAILVDIFANIIGGTVSKHLPSHFQWIKWPVSQKISHNKSWVAAIVSVILIASPLNLLPTLFSIETSVYTMISMGIATVAGDMTFSYYKRRVGIQDFFPSFGPKGGAADRVDGWTFILITAYICTLIGLISVL
jgi:CDP-diglyceride synthetase